MSIWSCARHNGMTGAGSDRDVGPTPVQRARFRERPFPEASKSQDLLATTGRTWVAHPGRRRMAIGMRYETYVSLFLALRCLHPTVSLHTPSKTPGCSMSCPIRVRRNDRCAGSFGTGFEARLRSCSGLNRYAAELQSVHHTTTHEGLIETCRTYTGHAEDPSRTARESGQRARFPGMAHGRSTREHRPCRDLQGTRWG